LALALMKLGALGAACSDDAAGADGGAPWDAGACGPGDATATPHGRVLVATEQYGSGGGITAIDLGTLEPSLNVALTSDDVTLRWFDHRTWVINRYGQDNLMMLDGGDHHLLRQVSVRPGPNLPCNPHDLLFLSTCRAYLSCYEQPSLYVIDPSAPVGEVITGAIDLAELADADGVPELSHLARVGDRVYVAVERLDRADAWRPVPPSYLAVIDPASDTLEDTIELQATNPVGPLTRLPGTADLLATASGDWDGSRAGLERIDTETATAWTALDAEALGGVPTAITVDETGCGFAVITTPGSYDTGVVRFCLDPARAGDGQVEPCLALGTFTVSDVALVDDGRLLVTDRSHDQPGLRVFDAQRCEEQTTAPIPTGFAPGFTNPLLLIPAAP
jgi:hypothetical protein